MDESDKRAVHMGGRFPPEIKQATEAYAAAHDLSIRQVMSRALVEFFEREGHPIPGTKS